MEEESEYKDFLLSTITLSNLPIFYNYKKYLDESKTYDLIVKINVSNEDTFDYIKSILDWITEENPTFRLSWEIIKSNKLIIMTPKCFFSQNKLFSSLFEEIQFDLSVTIVKKYNCFWYQERRSYYTPEDKDLFRIHPTSAGKGIFYYENYSIKQYSGMGLIFSGFNRNKDLIIQSENISEINLFVTELLGLSDCNSNLEKDYIALISLIKMGAVNNEALVNYILNNEFLLAPPQQLVKY